MTLTVETWCEALESGKYEQGHDWLRHDGGFCCLGVACDLSGLGTWTRDSDGAATFNYLFDNHNYKGVLPSDVGELLQIETDTGDFDFTALPLPLQAEIIAEVGSKVDPPDSLTALNDAGVPFPLIAKVIRARPKGLFREEAQP